MFTYRKWDGSGLGQLPDEKAVREHFGMEDHHVAYEVLDQNGNRVYFQYRDKFSGEYMTEDNWESVAQKHVREMTDIFRKQELLKQTGTEKVEIWVEARFKDAIESHHETLRKASPVEVIASEEAHAKELGLKYKVVDKLSDRQPVVPVKE